MALGWMEVIERKRMGVLMDFGNTWKSCLGMERRFVESSYFFD